MNGMVLDFFGRKNKFGILLNNNYCAAQLWHSILKVLEIKMKLIQIFARLIVFAFVLLVLIEAQDRGRNLNMAPDFVAAKVAEIAVTTRGSKWLVLRRDTRISPQEIFYEHRDAFYLGNEDQMEIVRVQTDNLGYTHYRYQQTYKGIKVEGAEMLVHARDGYVARTNGSIVTGLELSIQPAISEEAALVLRRDARIFNRAKLEES